MSAPTRHAAQHVLLWVTWLASRISGNFTIYAVQLSDYDPFASLATQPAQATLLTQPDDVQVYVDSSTRMLNSDPVVVGSTLRFYGLVFNDQGVLRMDCAQISDGVPLGNEGSSQSDGVAVGQMSPRAAKH
jgi:hypothetical protein